MSVVVEAQGLQERLFEVPVPPGDYGSLSTNGKRLFWLSYTASQPRKAALEALDDHEQGAEAQDASSPTSRSSSSRATARR